MLRGKFIFDGQHIQRSSQVSNKKDAAIVEAAFRTQLALGKIGVETPPKAPSFDKAADDCLQWLKIKHNENATYKRYFYAVQTLKECFKKTKINLIKPKDVENFIARRSVETSRKTNQPITRETINFELLTLKMMFSRLVESKILRDNPCAGIKSLAENKR